MRGARAFAAAAVVLFACACVCVAQQPPATEQRPAATAPTPQPQRAPGDVNEDFELNIAERRITEADFFASTSINGAAGSLSLRVGVALGAERIDVLLRNVRGRVRFRGSLDALRRVLDAHRPPPAAAAEPARPSVP